MSNRIEYNCEDISSSIQSIKIVTHEGIGNMKIQYKDSDTEYEFSNIEIDKLVDLERCYRKLTAKLPANTDRSKYNSLWSMCKYVNKYISNEERYKTNVKSD